LKFITVAFPSFDLKLITEKFEFCKKKTKNEFLIIIYPIIH